MKAFIYLVLFAFLVNLTIGNAQSDRIRYYLQLVAQGKVDEVKKDLPDMLMDYPDDPGIQLLHAVVIDDAFKAVDVYERIVKKYPTSDYADDAYWRIVQFYSVKGDTGRASSELEAYRKAFPTSQYLAIATDALRAAVGVTKTSGRTSVISLTKNHMESEKPKDPEKKQVAPAKKEVEKKETKETVPTTKKKGTYGLQVGIYSTQEAADSEVERFKGMRLKAEILNKIINGDPKFAVVIGDYSTKESAEAAKNIVQQQCNCSPLIFEK